MTKSFLINTSVAAIVSAFVFTAGVSSASARGDNDQYGHASQSDGYKGSYGGHYRKHYSHKPHYSYGRYGSRGYGHHPKHYSHNPHTGYGSYGGASSYGNYDRHYRKHHARPRGGCLMAVRYEGGQQVVDGFLGLSPTLAQLHQRAVHHDPVQPGMQLRPLLEAANGAEGTDEGVLDRVLRVLFVG